MRRTRSIAAPLLAGLLAVCGCGGEPAPEGEDRRRVEEAPPPARDRGRARDPRGGDPRPPPGARRAVVQDVVDGDTLTLSGAAGRSRLVGVDTPEVYGGAECFGREASRFAAAALAPGTRVRYALGVEPRDRHGRTLVYLWLPDGRFFNAMLVRRGYATPLTIPPNVAYAGLFARLARAARSRGRGLWARGACAGDPDRPRGTRPPAPAGDRDCGDFSSRAAAQAYFRSRGGPARDPDRLDADGDGMACDSLR